MYFQDFIFFVSRNSELSFDFRSVINPSNTSTLLLKMTFWPTSTNISYSFEMGLTKDNITCMLDSPVSLFFQGFLPQPEWKISSKNVILIFSHNTVYFQMKTLIWNFLEKFYPTLLLQAMFILFAVVFKKCFMKNLSFKWSSGISL